MYTTRSATAKTAVALLAVASVTLLGACSSPDGGGAGGDDTTEPAESSLVEQAQQEGEVVAGLGGHTEAQAKSLADAFEAKYGIKVTFVREASGSIAQKVQAQSTSGRLQFDVVSLNDQGTLDAWDDAGLLATPDVPNAGDILPNLLAADTANYLPFAWQPLGYAYNETKTTDAPATWADLAAADGVIAVADPGASGASLTFFTAMSEIQPDFVGALGSADTLTTDSALALTQLVATGESDFGLPASEPAILEAISSGEPLAMGYPEGKLVALPGYIASFAEGEHPAAGQLLVQFALSQEYQEQQTKEQTRAVLSTVSAPEGLMEISGDRMVVVPATELSQSRDDVVAAFSAALG